MRPSRWTLSPLVVLALFVSAAIAQTPLRVRGTIDGTLSTARVQVSKDGVKPPQ
jgi:hypothetical protein